jgi:hypothetical protein
VWRTHFTPDKENQMTILTGYFLSAGGLSAGLRVTRGLVRGTGRALAGDPRGALAEAAGGLIAPAVQVYREAGLLIADALSAAGGLLAGEVQSPPTLRTGGGLGRPTRRRHRLS